MSGRRIEMEHDFCTVDGARRLKQRIEEYWRERGYNVDVKLVDAGFVAAMRSARTDVRSDMVNGLPSRDADPAPARKGSLENA
ncbi:MAG: hypothetical protein NW203_09540 [Hyphomonadaceae bacterium]|nr:hypothetical protein [Hyphomonadaceae bacterium]